MNDLTVFQNILEVLRVGGVAVLCAVLDSEGSTPRGAGTRMAVLPDGRSVGTVGGGAVEQLVQREALRVLETGQPFVHDYAMTGGPSDTGLVCGGPTMVGCMRRSGADLEAVAAICALFASNEPGWLTLDFQAEPRLRIERGAAAACPAFDGGVYVEPLNQMGRVCVFGGGHVGQALVPVLNAIDCRVVVFDDRPEIAQRALFPDAFDVICGNYASVSKRLILTDRDAAVIMTHGHKMDLEVLCQVLPMSPGYVGCLGSRRKRAFIDGELAARGFDAEQIASVRLPIGLPIGAATPAEIAVSIAAELISWRASRTASKPRGCPAQ